MLAVQPYQRAHRRSVARQLVQPKGLSQLLTWFLREWSLEIPDTVHVPGVWRDYVRWDESRQSVGGSHLGAPALADPFRRYTENSASEYDAEGYYMRPMHRALVALSGRRHEPKHNACGRSCFMARYLFSLAWARGDIENAAATHGIRAELTDWYTREALHRLWEVWRPAAA